MPTLPRIQRVARNHGKRGNGQSRSLVHLVDHPLLEEHLAYLRSRATRRENFTWRLKEAAKILLLEALKSAPLKSISVATPLKTTHAKTLACPVSFVAILRAGLGLTNGMLELLPTAPIGHIGIFRDEKTFQPVLYYTKLPKTTPDSLIVLADPMLATGGSASEAIDIIKSSGCKKIVLVTLVCARKGIEALHKAHPDVPIYTAAIDPVLNANGYIVPGLGDCGDRLFGT